MKKYSLIFSYMVLEHVQSADTFHQNIFDSLKPGGKTIHFFATKHGLPSILNRVLPDKFTDWIIYVLQKRDPDTEAKYPAFYNYTYGPTHKAIKYFQAFGYSIEQYKGYLGHGYLSHHSYLHFIEKIITKFLVSIRSPYFCSNAIIILKKNR